MRAITTMLLLLACACGQVSTGESTTTNSSKRESMKDADGNPPICTDVKLELFFRAGDSIKTMPNPEKYDTQWLNAHTFIYMPWDGSDCVWLHFP